MKSILPKVKNKKDLLLVVALVCITTILTFLMRQANLGKEAAINISSSMSLKQIAKLNNVPVKEILHILSHEDRTVWQLPRGKSIKSIGIDIHELEEAVKHVREEAHPVIDMTKYIRW